MSQPTTQAVMYLRVASSDSDDSSKIAHQRAECQRIAHERELTVIREYVDRGRPGHFERQLELQRLVHDLAVHRDAAFVVVRDYSRLGRSLADFRVRHPTHPRLRGGGSHGDRH